MGAPNPGARRPRAKLKGRFGSARGICSGRTVVGRYWQVTPLTANEAGGSLTELFQVPLKPMAE